MKTLKKILLVMLVLALGAVCCFAVFAEGDTAAQPDKADSASDTDSGEVLTVGAEPAATENPLSVGLYLVDDEGNLVSGSGMSCTGTGTKLYIKHDYNIVAKYYNAKGETFDTEDELILGVDTDSPCVTLEHNKVKLAASDKPYELTIRVVSRTAESGEVSQPLSVTNLNFSMLEVLIAAVGVYIIVNALRGKGALFSNDFIKEDKKLLFKRLTIILALLAGVALIASGVLTVFLSYLDWMRIVKIVLLGVAIAALLGMSIAGTILTDKDKRMRAQETARTGGPTSSAAAFEFDEDEPTLDEVLEKINSEKENANKEN